MSSISGISSLQSIRSAHESAMSKMDGMRQKLGGEGDTISVATSFADRLQSSLNSVADAQSQAAKSVEDYELGREEDLSKVMVNQQISSLGFQLTMNVRNKALTAYKEIINMPV